MANYSIKNIFKSAVSIMKTCIEQECLQICEQSPSKGCKDRNKANAFIMSKQSHHDFLHVYSSLHYKAFPSPAPCIYIAI